MVRRPLDPAAVAAVLLDMDGTLVDSDAAVERAWTTWSVEYGLDPAAVLAVAHGHPSERTVRRVRPDLDERAAAGAAHRLSELEYHDLVDVVATPGALELIDVLHRLDLAWAVVTSADDLGRLAHLLGAGRSEHSPGHSP
jgi:beta-phosphoglucomutase-like phosphatase (HAD superfamily)